MVTWRRLDAGVRSKHDSRYGVSVCRGLFLQGAVDQFRHLLVTIGARPSGPKLVMQSLNASLEEPAPPLAHRRQRDIQPLSDTCIGQALRTGQDDASPLDQTVRH